MKKILFVDDVRLFLELEKTFFSRSEFQTFVAHSGREALAIIREHQPDLVFMDLYMPGMNGDECCRIIKGDPHLRHIPVIMVTQAGHQEELELCKKSGCDDILQKPIHRQAILSKAMQFIDVASRTDLRYKARVKVRFGPSANQTLSDYSINLSTGGLFLETDRLFPTDARLTIEFHIPKDTTAIHCQARVAWVNSPDMPKHKNLPTGMGLQFIGMRLEEIDRIREYLKEGSLVPFW